MRAWKAGRYALSLGAAAALVAGCGALPLSSSKGQGDTQPPVGAPESSAQAPAIARGASTYKVLYQFTKGGRHGYFPAAALINVNGTLYGTTEYGGSSTCHCGTVYSVSTSGVEHVLYAFAGGSDGMFPQAALIRANGKLYGTTSSGGSTQHGIVFSITTSGAEHVVHSFGGGSDGSTPLAGLIYANGLLYGTTAYGGHTSKCRDGCGTVFSISTSGKESVIYRFAGGSGDGADPHSPLIEVNGTFYGTTVNGGYAYNCDCGTVYSLSESGNEKMLYRFAGSDAAFPESGLVDVDNTMYGTTSGIGTGLQRAATAYSITPQGVAKQLYVFGSSGLAAGLVAVNGTLYGTTLYGGTGTCDRTGCGTIFSLTTSGREHVLHNFKGGSDGGFPQASMLDVNGTLYGATTCTRDYNNRISGDGTVFALTPRRSGGHTGESSVVSTR